MKWNIFRVTGQLCREFNGPQWIPRMEASDAELDMHLNKRLSKQSWGWWFETPSRPLWRHRNAREHWPYYITNVFSHVFQSKSSLNVQVVSITTLRPIKKEWLSWTNSAILFELEITCLLHYKMALSMQDWDNKVLIKPFYLDFLTRHGIENETWLLSL